MENVQRLKETILSGGEITPLQAQWLYFSADAEELFSASEEITRQLCGREFEMCSIINAKSGRCSENCKWCAQSVWHKTRCEVYPLLDYERVLALARHNEAQGVKRFSIVCSGKAPSADEVEKICTIVRRLKTDTGLEVCASLGLLDCKALSKLKEAGVSRYHCNLETASSHFPSLCSTHTTADKLSTLRAARESGLEVCSGGIIGMGETPKQRIELAFELKSLGIQSIPLNILCPIAGTPLMDMPPLGEEEILRTLAVFRFVLPMAALRFAGGRRQLSETSVRKAMRLGANAAIVGDMLTTLGSNIETDKQMIKSEGYEL